METTIAAAPLGKRGRKSSVILTDRMCEKRVTERTKIYDRKCPGLYVSITTAGPSTFSFKFTDRTTGEQRTGWLGIYNPETFTVEDARSKVYGLKGMGGNALTQTFRDQKAKAAQNGKTVSEIIEERINWMKTPVRKPDGEMRPRLEAWENTASHLRRFVGARLGKKLAREVTKNDIATLSNDIVGGEFGKPSVSNARQYAEGGQRPLQLGGRGGPRLRQRVTLHQSSEARCGTRPHPRSFRGRDQDILARPRR